MLELTHHLWSRAKCETKEKNNFHLGNKICMFGPTYVGFAERLKLPKPSVNDQAKHIRSTK